MQTDRTSNREVPFHSAIISNERWIVQYLGPMCMSLESRCIGVKAGKSLGVRKIFARISPNLPEKFSSNFLCEYFLPHSSWRLFFGTTSKKGLYVILQVLSAIFWNQTTLRMMFACMFRALAQIFRVFANIFIDFAYIFTAFARDFQEFCPDFRQIKTFGVRLQPLRSRFIHHYGRVYSG